MTANIGRDIPSSQLNLPLGFSFYFLRDSHSPDDVAGLQSVQGDCKGYLRDQIQRSLCLLVRVSISLQSRHYSGVVLYPFPLSVWS